MQKCKSFLLFGFRILKVACILKNKSGWADIEFIRLALGQNFFIFWFSGAPTLIFGNPE